MPPTISETDPDVYFDRPGKGELRVVRFTIYPGDGYRSRLQPSGICLFSPPNFVRLAAAVKDYADTLDVVEVLARQ